MQMALLTSIISPHQLPLAHELAKLVGPDHFRFIASCGENSERKKLGWSSDDARSWVLQKGRSPKEDAEIHSWLQNSEILLSGLREFELFERRAKQGLRNLYMSERWFKPRLGMLRLADPRYLRMARHFVRLLHGGSVTYLPIGVHAAQDMARLCGLLSGDLACSFVQPVVSPEKNEPMSVFNWPAAAGGAGSWPASQMRLWGYFVQPSSRATSRVGASASPLRILWAGRLLKLKRVDTIIRSVVQLLEAGAEVQLHLVGQGPEGRRLERLAGVWRERGVIAFQAAVPIDHVRVLMRQADVYVLSSNEYEGWGAVVNEAMGEGCAVVATRQCGSGATLIKDEENGLLFNAGDVNGLKGCLSRLHADPGFRTKLAERGRETVGQAWSPKSAAERLLSACEAQRYSSSPLAGKTC